MHVLAWCKSVVPYDESEEKTESISRQRGQIAVLQGLHSTSDRLYHFTGNKRALTPSNFQLSKLVSAINQHVCVMKA